MQEEFSESHGSLNTSDSEGGQEIYKFEDFKEESQSKIAIFDWDNTLFCTDYFDMLQLDYKGIFSEKKSIEEVGSYLLHELQSLEEVKYFLIKFYFRKF